MRRREFITLLGGAVTAWSVRARGQPGVGMRLIGVLLPIAKDDPEYQPWLTAFRQTLQELGWVDGRNMRMDIHWATANHAEIRKQAAELVALAPDVILAHGASTVGPLLQATRTVPIVFPITGDPVGAGFVDSLARPGGNVTSFMTFEYSMSGNGWSCSNRSRQVWRGLRSFGMRAAPPGWPRSASSRLWPRRSRWR